MSRRQEALLVIAACVLLFLTGLGDIPFHTRGEPREGLVVREMLERDEWLVPMRPERRPTRKPPLYYWLAALGLGALPSRPELALRLPSATLATAAVLGVWATARITWGTRSALPAALVLATSFEWARAATSARVDMTLAAATTAVLLAWTLVLAGRTGVGLRALAAVGATLGTLAKGPVALVLPGLAAAALRVLSPRGAERVRLGAPTSLALAAGAASLWYVAAYLRLGDVFLDVVTRENVGRFLATDVAGTGHEHGVPYLMGLWLMGLLPWTPLLPLALAPLWRRPVSNPVRLALLWTVVGAVFFSLASSKRSVYLLPLYPAVALLLAAGLAAPPGEGRLRQALRLGARVYAPALLVLAAGVAALAAGVDVTAPVRPWLRSADAAGAAAVVAAAAEARGLLGLFALGALLAAIAALRAVRRTDWHRLVLVVAVAAIGAIATFETALHPAIGRAQSMRDFLARVGRLVPEKAQLHAFEPGDPRLRFYADRPLAPWRPAASTGGYLLVWERDWRRLRDASGRPLRPMAVSRARRGRAGHLALVLAPAGVRTGT